MSVSTKFALAGALALSLAACQQPAHRICEGDKAHRTACVLLIVGAIKAVKLVALSQHHNAPRRSDIRLKHDIDYLATLDGGLKLYAFSYLGDDRRFIGVMAQDLLADGRYAGAVSIGDDGYYRVDYDMLGLGYLGTDAMDEPGARAAALAGS
jgi:hypothetical protein